MLPCTMATKAITHKPLNASMTLCYAIIQNLGSSSTSLHELANRVGIVPYEQEFRSAISYLSYTGLVRSRDKGKTWCVSLV